MKRDVNRGTDRAEQRSFLLLSFLFFSTKFSIEENFSRIFRRCIGFYSLPSRRLLLNIVIVLLSPFFPRITRPKFILPPLDTFFTEKLIGLRASKEKRSREGQKKEAELIHVSAHPFGFNLFSGSGHNGHPLRRPWQRWKMVRAIFAVGINGASRWWTRGA